MSSFWFDPMVQTVGMPGYGGGPQINTDYGGQLAQQQAYVGGQNQAALNAAGPTPPGYGFVGGYPSFGPAAAPGTYSPGSGRSSFSGVSLGGDGGDFTGMTDWQGRAIPSGAVERGPDLQAPAWQNPFAPQAATPHWQGGGIGSDAVAAPGAVATRNPYVQLPQNWQGTFNNTVHGDPYNPTPLGDSTWYPSQRTPYSGGGIGSDAHRGGQEGQSYSGMVDWRGNPIFNPGIYAGDQNNYGIPYNGKPQVGDIGFSKQPTLPNLGYNPGMANSFANPGMNANPFQNRFGMGFPNAGTPSQYAPGARMPPGFSPEYSVDQPGGALPLNWGQGGSYQPGG